MFTLTKAYKTKAMAVNAIRMTATNKGWTVLNTEEAAKHVWPEADGFAVNCTTLNLAYGFISPEDAELATNKLAPATSASGPVQTAVADALNEQKGKDKKAPKLQGKSNVEKGKAENLAKDLPAADVKQTRCTVVNNARRPLRGKTLLVWEVTERLQNQFERVPTLKEVHEQLLSMDASFNKTTTGIQYYACKAFNGWTEAK